MRSRKWSVKEKFAIVMEGLKKKRWKVRRLEG